MQQIPWNAMGENCMNITKKENIIFSNFCNDFGSTEYRVPKYV